MKKLRSLLKPYRRRLRIEALWKSTMLGLTIGIAVAAVVLALAKTVYHTSEFQPALIAGGIVAVLSAGLYYGIWCRPRWKDTTARVDALGLKERVTTMFILGENDSTISKLQREDALDKLHRVKPRQLKIRLLSRQLIAVVISAAFFGATMVMPVFSANDSNASAITAEQNKIIDELVAELKEKAAGLEINENTRSQLNAVIDELEQDLPACKTYVEKIARISRASDQINTILKSLLTKDIIGAALAKYEITRALGKAIINGDIEAVKAACEDLKYRFMENTGNSYNDLLKNLTDSLHGALELAKNAGVSALDELYMAIDTFAADSDNALTDANQGKDVTGQVNAAIDKAMTAIIAALGQQNAIEAAMEEIDKLFNEAKDKLAALEQDIELGIAESTSESKETAASEATASENQIPTQTGMPEDEEGDTPPETMSNDSDGAISDGDKSDGDITDDDILAGISHGDIQKDPVKIYDPDSGTVPYEDVYDQYYADALARMREKNTGSEHKDVVADYFDLLK